MYKLPVPELQSPIMKCTLETNPCKHSLLRIKPVLPHPPICCLCRERTWTRNGDRPGGESGGKLGESEETSEDHGKRGEMRSRRNKQRASTCSLMLEGTILMSWIKESRIPSTGGSKEGEEAMAYLAEAV